MGTGLKNQFSPIRGSRNQFSDGKALNFQARYIARNLRVTEALSFIDWTAKFCSESNILLNQSIMN
jgi:hypothetical protein